MKKVPVFMTILGLTESFKTMNRPDPTATLFDSLFLEKYRRNKLLKSIGEIIVDTIFIQVFDLCYSNFESISLIVWKLCAFRQCIKIGNFE